MTDQTEKPRRCHGCDLVLYDNDFYDKRKRCKDCVIKQVTKSQQKRLGLTAAAIKCRKCGILQNPDQFSFSEITKTYKTKCYGCRRNPGMPIELPRNANKVRYEELRKWLLELDAASSKEDMYYVKHILANHFIY